MSSTARQDEGVQHQTPKLHGGSRILLSDGHHMPVIALGTFTSSMLSGYIGNKTTASDLETDKCLIQPFTDTVKEAVKTSLDVGYRHIDSAYIYMIEKSVGQAFQEKFSEGTLKREDVFYTSKLWGTFHRPHLVRPALEKSLASLQLDFVDLFLIHYPMSLHPGESLFPADEKNLAMLDYVDLRQTWEAMEECKDAGLVKSIGVSNFNIPLLELILKKPDLKYKPVCNQVECHPYLTQEDLLEFCKLNDIVVTAYGVLGSPAGGQWVDPNCPALLQDPVLMSIGKKHKKTPAQVSIRYVIQKGCVPIVKSFHPDRIAENFQVFDFQLGPEEMGAIDKLNRNMRYWKFSLWTRHPNFHFGGV